MTEFPILQFGASRFLQAHVDLFVSEALPRGEAMGRIAVNWHGLGRSKSFNFQPHTLCVPQQPAPACNVTAPAAGVSA